MAGAQFPGQEPGETGMQNPAHQRFRHHWRGVAGMLPFLPMGGHNCSARSLQRSRFGWNSIMHAEIIAIGTELTTGAKLDTNSQWLSIELAAVGIPVMYHSTVGDDLQANISVLRTALERAEIVLITGGLGPTLDDLTREALAELAGVPLVLHQPSLQIIRDMFARRNRPMPDRNTVQAMFPEGSEPIPNPRGTAPGVWFELPRPGQLPCRFAAMPGVPSEMKWMFTHEVLPRLSDAAGGGRVIRQARLNCFGLGESHAEELLGDLTARGRDPEVGITVHEATITLRIHAEGATPAECAAKIEETKLLACQRLGNNVFGEEDDELQDVVVALLNSRGMTLSTGEIGTGGLLARWLTTATGYESAYQGGIVPLGGSVRQRWLVPSGSVPASAEVATVSLAHGCRAQFGSDWALAIGECPRPRGTETEPVPTAWLALCGAGVLATRELNLAGDPAILQSRLAKSALNLLRLQLLAAAPG